MSSKSGIVSVEVFAWAKIPIEKASESNAQVGQQQFPSTSHLGGCTREGNLADCATLHRQHILTYSKSNKNSLEMSWTSYHLAGAEWNEVPRMKNLHHNLGDAMSELHLLNLCHFPW